MVYECKHCGYSTNRQSNFLRHKNRKNPCFNTDFANQNIKNKKNGVGQNIVENGKNIVNDGNIIVENGNIIENNLQCIKCQKSFISKKGLIYHLQICKGVDSLTCEICLMKFINSDKKYRHRKKEKCKPPPPPKTPQQILSQTINNNITNNTTNNITNNLTNNIHINVFGKEDLNYLLNDKNILQKLKSFGKSGIYGLPKIISDVHFNKDKPENNTLIKPDEYGNGVMIMNDDKEWEYREFEDIRDNLINTIIRYFKAYNTVKNSLGVKLIEKKERNIIKNCAYELMTLEGSIPRDLFEELEMNEDDVEENEEELKNKLRKFDKSTMKNIHQKTSLGYKKENGSYVKKILHI